MKNNILLALIIVLLTGCAGILKIRKNINDNKNAIDEFNKQTYKLVSKDEFLKKFKMVSLDNYVVDEKHIYNSECKIKLVRKQFSTITNVPSTLIGGINYIFIKKDGKIQSANCSTYLQILALTDCITVPLSEDTLCSYNFQFGPTSDVKNIDAVDEIDKIRDSYVVKNRGLIFSMGTKDTGSGNLPTISYAYKVIEEKIVDLGKRGNNKEIIAFRNVTKGGKGRHSSSKIMSKSKDCFINSKYGYVNVKAYSTGSIDFVVFNDGEGYALCKNSIAGPLKKPKIYSQKEFAERKIFYKKQNNVHNGKLYAEKKKKAEKEKNEYISKYFYTKEDLLKILKTKVIYENDLRSYTECLGAGNRGNYYDTMTLGDDGSVACYTSKEPRLPAVKIQAKWSITDCKFNMKKGVVVKVPAVKISRQHSDFIFVLLNKPLEFEIENRNADGGTKWDVVERSSDYYSQPRRYYALYRLQERSGIKCTDSISGKIKARKRSIETNKRKGIGIEEAIKNAWLRSDARDVGVIYVDKRTGKGADPYNVYLYPKSQFLQGHTPEKALAAFKKIKYTKKQRYIFYDEMWEHMKPGKITGPAKAILGDKGIWDLMFMALELTGVDRVELDKIKEKSKEKFYTCFERDLGNINNNLKGRIYLFMLKHSEYTGRLSFNNIIEWGKVKGATDIVKKFEKGGKESKEILQIMILTPIGCFNQGVRKTMEKGVYSLMEGNNESGMTLEEGINSLMEKYIMKK